MKQMIDQTILDIATHAISGDSFYKSISTLNTQESKMLLNDIDLISKTSKRFIVLVHPDDSAEAHIVLSDEEIIDLSNTGTKFFRFSMR